MYASLKAFIGKTIRIVTSYGGIFTGKILEVYGDEFIIESDISSEHHFNPKHVACFYVITE